MIRILIQNRVDAFDSYGGDTVAMMFFKKHLENHGIKVDISLELEPNLENYDIVHLFNIIRIHETYTQFKNAKKQNKPVVITPTYWDFNELEEKGRKGGMRRLRKLIGVNGFEFIKNIFRILKDDRQKKSLKYQFYKSYIQQQKEVIRGSDIVTPNSLMEENMIRKKFGEYKHKVVYNGVDPEIFLKGEGKKFRKKYKMGNKKFGLCVGRFDERKNQLNLIKAIKKERIPLVFIGNPSPNYFKYFLGCKKEANFTKIKFINHLSQKELANAYAAAHFYVQPSWLETPGLASLEAAINNCNVVLTDRGSVREYFGDFAWYCDPDDLDSIKRSVLAAFNKKRGFYSDLKAKILKEFTWRKSARVLLDAYRLILEKKI